MKLGAGLSFTAVSHQRADQAGLLDDGEALLDRRIEVAEETHLGKDWLAYRRINGGSVRLSPRIITH